MDKVAETVQYLKDKGVTAPSVGIILGTGLGKLIKHFHIEQKIDYVDIPNFPVSTVEFHKGRLVIGKMNGKRVIAMQGRFHYYEGYSLQEITFPVRVMQRLGVGSLLISNAGGALNLDFPKGTIMLIDDHINLLPGNPLIGPNDEELGPRFPDMSEPYDPRLNELFRQTAKELKITLHEGVYVAVPGPNLETRAEYRFLRRIGADVVGMSTIPEVIVANHMGLPCAAVSVITDECDPDNLARVDIDDIIATASRAEEDLIKLFNALIPRI
jgi:purine-nucleoside phosphorylase